MDEFKKWLSRFRCEKGVPFTHTSIGNPKVSVHIPDESMSEFYEVYTRAMVQGTKLYLTEKPNDPSPMRVDLDFRFPMPAIRNESNQLPRLYTKTDLERILAAYYEILVTFLDTNDAEQLTAYVMEKPVPVEYRGKLKDGIHVVWPHLVVSHSFQFMIRKHIMDRAATLFQGMSLCNPYQDVVDEAIIDRNNWQMYGSCKPDCDKYQVTSVYTYNVEEAGLKQLSQPSAVEEIGLVELFSMRGKQNKPTKLKDEKVAEYEEYVRHVLPSIDERRKNKLHSQIFGNAKNLTKNFISEDDFILARQLVTECLSPRRAEHYEDWIKLGWTLRNIDHRLLETWMEFSKVSSKFVEGECQGLWEHMRIDTMGMGTLRWWARQDNPMKYNEIMDQSVCSLIDQCANSSGAHFDVARVVHALYKDKYRFTVKDTWYTFVDSKHRWVRTREGLKLRLILSCDVCTKFMERGAYWNSEASKAGERGDEISRSLHLAKSKTITEICVKLKSAGYKNSVMTECKGLFTDEKFEELLDSHPHLIGFENGVYDLKMHEFRDGLPDDYISFSTGKHYIDFNPESVEASEIHAYLGQVFTDAQVRKYMLDVLACIIDGSIRQEKFYIFTGSGCHAIDTEIMMYDGTKKKVQDVNVGDMLMGDDSTPRNVLQLFRGTGDMYRIVPKKGESFVVNADHVLSLKFSDVTTIVKRSDSASDRWRTVWHVTDGENEPKKQSKTFASYEDALKYKNEEVPMLPNVIKKGDVIDVQVKNLLTWYPWWYQKGNACLFRPDEVKYDDQNVDVDPYILGCWLGDGHSKNPIITNMDLEVIEYLKNNMPENHVCKQIASNDSLAKNYSMSFCGKREKYASQNEILNGLRKYNLLGNKHIPHEYKANSRDVRLKLLAGILDTDGTYQAHTNQYTISQKSEQLMDDIIDLARSLGFACYKKKYVGTCHNNGAKGTYYRTNIVGNGLETIPCLIPRKQAVVRNKVKNPLLNSFTIESVGVDKFYGFELDGNHRYALADYTITHNSNSKSKYLELLQKAIGDYYCILPIALLTQKRVASNAAQSELERTKGRRFAIMQEPGESEKINIGLMKELSGGDRILTRGLFKDPVEFKPQFTMIMTCNELPEVPSDDGGTWRRIRVIAFTSKFVEHPDPKNPLEFPLDGELMDKFERWSETFISMLIHHHSQMDPKNIAEPHIVKTATEGYKKNNDLIGQYCEEMIEYNPESEERTQLVRGYMDFKSWVGDITARGCGKKMPDRNQFKAYMEKKYGLYTSKGWKGVILKSSAADDSDVE